MMRFSAYLGKRLVQMRMQQMLRNRDVVKDESPMHLKLPPSDEPSLAKRLLAELTLQEKISLLSGVNEFCIPGVERVGLKPVWSSDATLALRGWKAPVTVFPASVSMAATFNTDLVTLVGDAIGSECRSLGIGILLAPGVNLARVPICGRNFEYFGEDPYLSGEMAAAYVTGVQQHPVIATVKHFALNNSEYDRHKTNSMIDERTLRELYLPAFKRALEAGSLAVMTSYNQVNGTYASEHPYLLEGILRGEWQFNGLVISDWNSLYSTDGVLKCGADLEMPGGKYLTKEAVMDALERGVVDETAIDQKVGHLLSSYEKAGLFACPMVDATQEVGCSEHHATALQVAREGIVLLQNKDQALPLKEHWNICIGGDNAFRVAQGGGSSMVQWEQSPQSLASLVEGSCTFLPRYWYYLRSYRKRVASSDAVILVVGFNHIEESEAYDRPWQLDHHTLASIKHATSCNERVILVVQSGGAVDMAQLQGQVSAILWTSYLGCETAQALKDVLYGVVSPSGKLPFSIASSLADYRSMRTYPKDYASFSLARIHVGQGKANVRTVRAMQYTENLMVGYRQFDSEGPNPLFCFGHGLSYSSFSYHDLSVKEGENGAFHLSFFVKNTGLVDAPEVAQLYIAPLDPQIYRPKQELKRFEKLFLKAGEQRSVVWEVDEQAFARWDQEHWKFVSDSGNYAFRVGSSSRDIRLEQVVVYAKRKP
ncbi:MAG: beta-glucosidase [Sphaerochaeta sp.]